MEDKTYSIKEIKLTAMVYASRSSLVDYVRLSGKLPHVIPMGRFHIAMRVLIEKRGTDPILTENEKLVYDAILREKTSSWWWSQVGGSRLMDLNSHHYLDRKQFLD